MAARRTSAFIDAIAAGQRPKWKHSKLGEDDLKVVRTAINLRAARPGGLGPNEDFVAGLHGLLADELHPSEPPKVQSLFRDRVRSALVAAAAAVALIGGTVAVTEAANLGGVTSVAVQAPHDHALLTGSFETAQGQVLGQIVVHPDQPSWVFMKVSGVNSYGAVRCELHMNNGDGLAAGTIHLHDGTGVLSHTVKLDASQLSGATLYSPSGAVLGSATLA